MSTLRQLSAFGFVGVAAAAAHYACLVGLVEGAKWSPVPATLLGYVAGGIVSYAANRQITFATGRTHRAALWRFVVVAGVGFCLTWFLMSALTIWAGVPYLLSQLGTTGCVMLWSFVAHKFWTFAEVAPL